jgi:hypothetical protein
MAGLPDLEVGVMNNYRSGAVYARQQANSTTSTREEMLDRALLSNCIGFERYDPRFGGVGQTEPSVWRNGHRRGVSSELPAAQSVEAAWFFLRSSQSLASRFRFAR